MNQIVCYWSNFRTVCYFYQNVKSLGPAENFLPGTEKFTLTEKRIEDQ